MHAVPAKPVPPQPVDFPGGPDDAVGYPARLAAACAWLAMMAVFCGLAFVTLRYRIAGPGLPSLLDAPDLDRQLAPYYDAAAAAWADKPTRKPADPLAGLTVKFSPKGGCTAELVAAIDAASESVKVQAYYLTSEPVCAALERAGRRGVAVRVIVDRTQPEAASSLAGPLAHQLGKDHVRVDYHHAIHHNKITIVDDRVVLTGSFNFTKNAEEANAENLVPVREPAYVAAYVQNFEDHWEHSTTWGERPKVGAEPPAAPPEEGVP